MKQAIFFVVILFCSAGALAEHNGGTDFSDGANASCNASFNQNCFTDQTYTADSSGFAAPAGELGSSAIEIVMFALFFATGIGARLHRSNARQ